MTDPDLTSLATPERVTHTGFRALIPDGWQQGRGAFGGLVLGLLSRAMEQYAGDSSRTLRALTAELCGPTLAGEAQILVETLRAGTGVTTCAGRLIQGGEVQAHAVGVFGRERAGGLGWSELARPAAPDWRTVAPAPFTPPLAPPFAQHFDLRVAAHVPFAGAATSGALGWIRAKNPGRAHDAAHLVTMADGWFPAAFARMEGPRPMSTLAFTVEIVIDPATVDPSEPLLHVASTPIAWGGFAVELRQLWTEDGRLAALNQQTFAIIK